MRAIAVFLLVLADLALCQGWTCTEGPPLNNTVQVDAGLGQVVAIDKEGQAYILTGSSWTRLPYANLKHISVGKAGIWGTNIEDKSFYQYVGGNWVRFGGANVAKGGIATQSSLYDIYGKPQNAIDGNRASHWNERSCTHTQNDLNPWWRVDLRADYKVTYVTVTNRKDCCANRLNGAEIRIGDSLSDNGNGNKLCATMAHIGAGVTETFSCRGITGRYVNIVIPGRREYLTLAEVEVYGVKQPAINYGANVAKGGIATQSSLYDIYGKPQNAIDGNRASHWNERSCTHTQNDLNPWWRVDLRADYKVTYVTVTNRKDCCANRLNGAEIRIGDSLSDNGNGNKRCTVIHDVPAGVTETYNCGGMTGRYVNIVIPGRREYLTLAEVEVYGQASGGSNQTVEVGSDGKVFEVDKSGQVVERTGISEARPNGSGWKVIPLCKTMRQVSYDLGTIYGVSTDGAIMKCTA